MKCIKSKCPQYIEHDFRLSYYVCRLDGCGRLKDKEFECDIDDAIQESVKTTKEFIKLKEEIRIINENM